MKHCPKCNRNWMVDGNQKCPYCNCGLMLGSAFAIPTVAGRRIRGSNADFERACLVHIERLQNGLGDYDSAMLDTFCEAVRLCREYSNAMAMITSPFDGSKALDL